MVSAWSCAFDSTGFGTESTVIIVERCARGFDVAASSGLSFVQHVERLDWPSSRNSTTFEQQNSVYLHSC